MSAPPLLAAATLLLWGFAIGFPAVGVALAIVVEGARWLPIVAKLDTPRRLALTIRAAFFLVGGTLAWAAATSRFPEALYLWLRTLPLCLAPLPIAQFAARGSLPLSAVYDAGRSGSGPLAGDRRGDATFLFIAATLVAAGTGNKIDAWFYIGASVIVTWALIARVPRASWIAATLMVALAVGIGYGVHRGLWLLQGELEEMDLEALRDFFTAKADPLRERTRIGDVGKLKLKDRIVMRVFADDRKPQGVLLRESAFDEYRYGEWRSTRRAFQPVDRRGERWVLRDQPAARSLVVRKSMPGGEGVLALPAGASAIDGLAADAVERLETGAVRAKGTPRFLTLRIDYDEAAESGTIPADLEVPAVLAAPLDRLVSSESLERGSPRATLAAVEAMFAAKFRYSLGSEDRTVKGRTLADFLTTDRKGHCEYFATATTLLLRRLGIPARYTVGYAAQEWSALEKAFVVRHRHAHAWTSAYLDGRWTTVDTTPAQWAEAEAEEAHGPFASLLDLFSYVIDRAIQWWVESSPSEMARMAAIVVLIALAPFGARALLRRLRGARVPAARASYDRATLAWRKVEKQLARRGFARLAHETPREFAQRIRAAPGSPPWSDDLAALVQQYYRACFDPEAHDATERFPAEANDFVRRATAPRPRLAPARG